MIDADGLYRELRQVLEGKGFFVPEEIEEQLNEIAEEIVDGHKECAKCREPYIVGEECPTCCDGEDADDDDDE